MILSEAFAIITAVLVGLAFLMVLTALSLIFIFGASWVAELLSDVIPKTVSHIFWGLVITVLSVVVLAGSYSIGVDIIYWVSNTIG